jgi:bifunctional non-homologous end joining protein LigD
VAEIPDAVAPMLAMDSDLPGGDAWAYEYKWDGYRCCLRVAPNGTTRLTSRNGNDLTPTYPELAQLPPSLLQGRAAVIDGEIVALDAEGRPDFGLLQQRRQRGPTAPVTYFAFDLLLWDRTPLLAEPYHHRRELLTERLHPAATPHLAIPPHYPGSGITPDELLAVVREYALEGLVAKRLDSPYLPGRRTRLWRKKALFATQEVVIGGWQPGQGYRAPTIGSLLLGAYDPQGRLRYIGHVGSGFTHQALTDLLTRLTPLEQPTSPFTNPVPSPQARHAHWTAPRLVATVAYRTWTREQRLRHPVWRELRDDTPPEEATL